MKSALHIFFLHGICFFPILAISQIPNQHDCPGGVSVCQPTFYVSTLGNGQGTYLNEFNNQIICLNLKSDTLFWIYLQNTEPGLLGFNLIPDENVDLDWVVWDITNHNCEQIKHFNSGVPVLDCNYSGSTFPTSVTGANGGSNPQDGPLIMLPPNREIVLMVQPFLNLPNNFIVDFTLSSLNPVDHRSPVIESLKSSPYNPYQLILRFSENVICQSVNANDFNLSTPDGVYTAIMNVSGAWCDGADYSREFVLTCSQILDTNQPYLLKYNGNAQDRCGNVIQSPVEVNFTATTGIHSNHLLAYGKIFPNPTSGFFTLETQPGSKMELLDNQGRLLLMHWVNDPTFSVDVSFLEAGIYWVRTTLAHQSGIIRLIKL